MTQAEALYQLQQIDLGILRTQKRLDEIAAQLNDNQAVITAQQTTEAAAKALSPPRTKARDLELEIQSTGEKATSTEQQLYSGTVKNPKAMQEMQQEIEALKRRKSELEDKLLEAMLEVDQAQSVLDQQEADLQKITAQWEAGHTGLLQEQTELIAKVGQLQIQRENSLKPISAENLKTYNALKKSKANQPMSLMSGISCSLCGIEQTMNIVQEARRGDKLVPCVNCGRILVYKP